jgi:hypothetical protein
MGFPKFQLTVYLLKFQILGPTTILDVSLDQRGHVVQCKSTRWYCPVTSPMPVPVQRQSQSNASSSPMPVPVQCQFQFNPSSSPMPIPVQCLFQSNASSSPMPVPVQCQFQSNASPSPMPVPVQCQSQSQCLPNTGLKRWSFWFLELFYKPMVQILEEIILKYWILGASDLTP